MLKRLLVCCLFFAPLWGVAQDKAMLLDSFFIVTHAAGNFNGNVLIAEKGKIIYQESFGMADLPNALRNNAETMFELASVSKQFTAMGIMLLKKQGKLSYEDTLRKFFPELPYQNITLRQLLNHTSGLPDYMELFSKEWTDTTKIANNKDMLVLLAQFKPDTLFYPGKMFDYSNTGYALLASIIEKASGMTYAAYLTKYIFKPLKMTRTEVLSRRYEKRSVSNYAYGYVKSGTAYVLADSLPNIGSMVYCLDGIQGDGTVNSTTGDLFKWDRALYTEKLVSTAMQQEAFTPGAVKEGKTSEYGFGWAATTSPVFGRLVNHSGGWPGYLTLIERHLDNDKTIIVLSNYESRAPVKQIRNILYSIVDTVSAAVKSVAAELLSYGGEYELMPGFVISITTAGDQIYAQATGQAKFEIYKEKEDLYFLKVVEAKVRFVKDERGQVHHLVLYQNGQEKEGLKIK